MTDPITTAQMRELAERWKDYLSGHGKELFDGLRSAADQIDSLRATQVIAAYAAESLRDSLNFKDGRIAVLTEALTRLRDCDWVITPLDRMDAVRDIARKALVAVAS